VAASVLLERWSHTRFTSHAPYSLQQR
jgi:hypothetical protein